MTSLRFTLPIVVSLCAGGPASASVEDSVGRVFASMRLPHPLRPWAKQNPMDTMGTGVVIDGKVILTNAHIVVYADEIFVQGREGGDRVPAKVQSIGLDADLATLTLEEEDFFKDRPPLTMASKRPSVGQVVTLYGYAVGNSGLSTTQGPVSRIEYGEYIDRGYGLRLQVNATAWPGNSGGPAVVDGKMAGLVFRRLENMAYVIPDEEILEYLEDVKDGRYDGKPQLTDK